MIRAEDGKTSDVERKTELVTGGCNLFAHHSCVNTPTDRASIRLHLTAEDFLVHRCRFAARAAVE